MTSVVLVVLLLVFLEPVAVRLANRYLPEWLHTAVVIGDLDLDLFRGQIVIRDIRIDQPEGFGEGPMLSTPELRGRIGLASLLDGPIKVKNVSLKDAELNLVKEKGGRLNLLSIFEGSGEGSGDGSQETTGGMLIYLKKISVEALSASYTDRSVPGEPQVSITVGIDCLVQRFLLDTSFGKDPSLKEETRNLRSRKKYQGRGVLDLKSVQVSAVPKVAGAALLEMDRLHLEMDLVNLSEILAVDELSLSKPRVQLVRGPGGNTNLKTLIESFSFGTSPETGDRRSPAAGTAPPHPAGGAP